MIITEIMRIEMTFTYEARGILRRFIKDLFRMRKYCTQMLALKLIKSVWSESGTAFLSTSSALHFKSLFSYSR
jgi:hypothetical protein